MRILPEWKGYDDTIKRLQHKIQSEALDAHSEFNTNQPEKVAESTYELLTFVLKFSCKLYRIKCTVSRFSGHSEKHTEL